MINIIFIVITIKTLYHLGPSIRKFIIFIISTGQRIIFNKNHYLSFYVHKPNFSICFYGKYIFRKLVYIIINWRTNHITT